MTACGNCYVSFCKKVNFRERFYDKILVMCLCSNEVNYSKVWRKANTVLGFLCQVNITLSLNTLKQ